MNWVVSESMFQWGELYHLCKGADMNTDVENVFSLFTKCIHACSMQVNVRCNKSIFKIHLQDSVFHQLFHF